MYNPRYMFYATKAAQDHEEYQRIRTTGTRGCFAKIRARIIRLLSGHTTGSRVVVSIRLNNRQLMQPFVYHLYHLCTVVPWCSSVSMYRSDVMDDKGVASGKLPDCVNCLLSGGNTMFGTVFNITCFKLYVCGRF